MMKDNKNDPKQAPKQDAGAVKKEEKKEEKKEDKKEEKIEEKKDQDKGDKTDKNTEEEDSNIQVLKKGDYQVHILVEEVRNLVGKVEDDLVFPAVKLTVFGKDKKTHKVSAGCSSYSFIEHFYFEKNNLTVEELDSEKILIEVMDTKNSSRRSDYLGIYEFDFTFIYKNKDHCLNNFWIALANPESDDMTKVRGFLKLSVSVLHENDKRVELFYRSTDDPHSLCIVPPQIKMKYHQVSLNILHAEQIPDMEGDNNLKVGKRCQGYIIAKYLGYNVKSSVKEMIDNKIIWNEIIEIPVSDPIVSQRIILEVWDEDKGLNSDDLVGSFEIDVNDIIKKKYENLQYFHVYGSPLSGKFFEGLNKKYRDKMNLNPEFASLWKGRILLKIDSKITDTPMKALKSIKDKNLISFAAGVDKKKEISWLFNFFLYEALYLPFPSDEYKIQICVEDKIQNFAKLKADNGNITFNHKSEDTFSVCTLTDKIEELSDVFIYLVHKEKNICFQRIPAKEFLNNQDIMVIKLLPDPTIDKLNDYVKSGLVKIKIQIKQRNIAISKKPINRQDSDVEEVSSGLGYDRDQKLRDRNKKPEQKKPIYMIVANIHMSRYLVAGDSTGTSDPYVLLRIGNTERKTTVKYDSVNCIWNETLFFENIELDEKNKASWPVIFLKMMDKDLIKRDDLLAYSYLWLSDSNYKIFKENRVSQIMPKWEQLYLPKSNRPQGEILISFSIVEMSRLDLIEQLKNSSIVPLTTNYSFEINVLGLRDLQPLSILPVKKPYICFDLNSINVTGKADKNMKFIKTQPKKAGFNPTINTVIKFDVELPIDDIFMPELQCIVYDWALAGMINSILGIFVIDLKELIKKNKEKIEYDLRLTDTKLGFHLISKKMLADASKMINPDEDINLNFSKYRDVNSKDNSVKEDEGSPKERIKDIPDTINEIGLLPKEKQTKSYNLLQEDLKEILLNVESKESPKKEMVINNQDPRTVSIDLKTGMIAEEPLKRNFLSKKEEAKKIHSDIVLYPQYQKYIIPGTKPGKPGYQEYEKENREIAPTRESGYEEIGYSRSKKDGNKHYRRRVDCALEESPEFNIKSPFEKIPIRRGKFVDKTQDNGIFDAITDKSTKILKRFTEEGQSVEIKKNEINTNKFFDDKSYGDFKGLIRIIEKEKMNQFEQIVENIKNKSKESGANLMKDFKYLTSFEDISKRILIEKEVVVRVYILKLMNLKNMDEISLKQGDESDPYVKLYLGGKVIDESKYAIDNKANCDWCKCYDIPAVLPGAGVLKIEAWDYDVLFSDDLIGYTKIDLEDRFFNNNWRDLSQKPIEVRPLRHPDYEQETGRISLWVEIFERNDPGLSKKWNINPAPLVDLEMRLVVWEAKDTPCMDVEDMSDYYFTCFIDDKQRQSTDVHFRCEKGFSPSFNWRIVLPIKAPTNNDILKIQLMDNDFFSKDDFAADADLRLNKIIEDVYELDIPIKFNKDYFDGLGGSTANPYIEFDSEDRDKFWLTMKKNGGVQEKNPPKVLLSLEILPSWKASVCKVGKGRDEPNCNPYLPPPVGRFKWTMNPFKLLNQCVGAQYRRKFYCALCCTCLIIYLVFLIPYVIWHLSGEAVNPFNYVKSSSK